jgi:hypothetical protein
MDNNRLDKNYKYSSNKLLKFKKISLEVLFNPLLML